MSAAIAVLLVAALILGSVLGGAAVVIALRVDQGVKELRNVAVSVGAIKQDIGSHAEEDDAHFLEIDGRLAKIDSDFADLRREE
jgi:hypothetical protein